MKYYKKPSGVYIEVGDSVPVATTLIEVTKIEYDASPTAVEKRNATIKAKIKLLDLKRIRPLAEGDAVYLQQLNDQIKTLRAQLV